MGLLTRDGPPPPPRVRLSPPTRSYSHAKIDGGMPMSPENGSAGSSYSTSIKSSHPPGGGIGVPMGIIVLGRSVVVVFDTALPTVFDRRCDVNPVGRGMDINPGGGPVPLRALRCPGMVRVGDLVLLLSTPLPILDLPPTPPPPTSSTPRRQRR